MDKLDKIFKLQNDLQKKMPGVDKVLDDPSYTQMYINEMILAMLDELGEVLRETAWKNPDLVPYGWKKHQKYDKEKFKEELVDLLHFFVNLCLVSGMNSEELYARYCGKREENISRQERGY